MIRVAIIDDHRLFRKGLAALIETNDDMQVTLEGENGQELIDALNNTTANVADVVILDLEMPVMDGQQTAQMLQKDYPEVKPIIVSMHNDSQFIIDLMEAGARGYLLKNAAPEEMETAIRSVHETGYFFNDTVSRTMLHGLVAKNKVTPQFKNQDALSQRELEVLQLICEEYTTAEIGEKLFISPRTVEGHRNNILLKTGARNTAGMVVYAIKHQLFDPAVD